MIDGLQARTFLLSSQSQASSVATVKASQLGQSGQSHMEDACEPTRRHYESDQDSQENGPCEHARQKEADVHHHPQRAGSSRFIVLTAASAELLDCFLFSISFTIGFLHVAY